MIYHHSSTRLPEIEDNSIGVVITSPPYPGIVKWDKLFIDQGCGPNAGLWKDSIDLITLTLQECFRVLIPGGILSLNIGDATRSDNGNFQCWPNFAALTVGCKEIGFDCLIPILWKKISNRPNAFLGSGFQPVNAYVSQDCEYIGIFRKGRNRTFVGEEKERRKASSFTKEERDLWFQQVWTGIPGAKGSKISSSWNMEIPYRLLRMFSIQGDTILDPFCGKIGGKLFEELCTEHGRQFVGYTI